MHIDESIAREFIQFSLQLGSQYLGNGGPTSRLEKLLSELGQRNQLQVEIFATPTGLFMSARTLENSVPVTAIHRIRFGTINLAEVVRLESIVDGLSLQKLNFTQARELLKNSENSKGSAASTAIFYGAAFFSGVSSSYFLFVEPWSALLSGTLTVLICWLSGLVSGKFGLSGIFSDFVSSFVAISLSGGLGFYLGLPPGAIVIGALVLLVPGLLLTNAISELAEHNFVSGTAKMMRALLILLAMGTAFLISQDLAFVIDPSLINIGNSFGKIIDQNVVSPWVRFISNMVLIVSFAVLFKVPARALFLALITGFSGWGVLQLFHGTQFLILGSFLPALSVGTLSLLFSRFLKVPSQIFSVPGIISMVPGLLALSSFSSFTSGEFSQVGGVFFQAAVVSASITFGLFTARVPFLPFKEMRKQFDSI